LNTGDLPCPKDLDKSWKSFVVLINILPERTAAFALLFNFFKCYLRNAFIKKSLPPKMYAHKKQILSLIASEISQLE
jgi:hypothetical protein